MIRGFRWFGAATLLIAQVGCGAASNARDMEDMIANDAGGSSSDASTTSGAQDAAQPGDSAVSNRNDAGAPVTSNGSRWVMGYYVGYQRDKLPVDKIDWTGLSHIIFGRLKARPDGTLEHDFDIDNTAGPALARDIAKRAHDNGKKALLMLGGDGQGPQIAGANSTQNRAKFVSALLKAVKDYGYDGLDLDWEGDGYNVDAFILLAKALRESPDAPAGLILTVPGGAYNLNYDKPDPKLKDLATYVDRYTSMSYYPVTAWAGQGWQSWHNSPLLGGAPGPTPTSIDTTLKLFTDIGIPKAKLAMGIAFYAICYTGGVTAPRQSTDNSSIEGGDNAYPLSDLFATGGDYKDSLKKWDDVAKNSYLTLPTANKFGCRYVSFEDEQSIEAKGKFTRDNGYGGIIIWTLGQGAYLTNSQKSPTALMQALKRAFLD